MNSLINIQNKKGQLLVSSREVAMNFEKRHDHILRDIENLVSDSPKLGNETLELGNEFFIFSRYRNTRGQLYPEYLLTRDGFTLLAMGFTGSKALEWKLKYIEAFNKMEKALKEQIPEIDSQFMYRLAGQLEEKEKQIALMEPKARFADAITTSKQSVLVGELAKVIAKNGVEGIGQNRLFKWLREHGYLHKIGEQYNLPTQLSIELEIIEVKTTTINNPDGSVRVTKTPKVTGKGQVYFVNKFLEKIA